MSKSLKISDEAYELLDSIAQARGESRKDFASKIIQEYIEEDEELKNAAEKIREIRSSLEKAEK